MKFECPLEAQFVIDLRLTPSAFFVACKTLFLHGLLELERLAFSNQSNIDKPLSTQSNSLVLFWIFPCVVLNPLDRPYDNIFWPCNGNLAVKGLN